MVQSRSNYGKSLFEEYFNTQFKLKQLPTLKKSDIKQVIHNNPATIVIWSDGSKTVVKCQDGDTYSEELGLAMCICKKVFSNKGNFNEVFKEWCSK